MKKDTLQDRLRNCLQTILDLEPEIERLDLGDRLLHELNVLKSYVRRLDSIDIQEKDVERIEEATSSFLEELKDPMDLLGEKDSRSKVLH